MPSSPKVAIPLKTTKDLDWASPLETYIRNTYGNSENFSKECQMFSRLRQDIMGAGKDATGRDLLYKYYGQLELLDLRIPVEEGACKVGFTWMDAFTHAETTQHSLAFEKASILFNLASTNSYIAVETSDLKVAYKTFQASAGIYTFVAENFLHAPSADLNRDTVRALASLMLAQAQEVFVERLLVEGTTKPNMLTKLAKSASMMYKTAVEGLSTAVAKGWGERDWVLLASVQQYYMDAVANHQQGLLQSSKGKQGLAIAYLRSAISKSDAAIRSYLPSTYSAFMEILTAQHTELTTTLSGMEKDNDFIYHDNVPAANSVLEIGPLEAAKPTQMSDLYADQDITQLIGRDIFEKLIPVSVAEQSSMYSEEKAKVLRAEGEKVDVAEEEVATALEYLGLPAALKMIRTLTHSFDDGRVDELVAQWAQKVQISGTVSFADIEQKKRDIYQVVERCERELEAEERDSESMRSKLGHFWTQSPSVSLTTTLKSDLHSIKESLWTATTSDRKLQAQYAPLENDVRILAQGPNSPELASSFKSPIGVSTVTKSLVDMEISDRGGNSGTATPDTDAVENLLKKLTKLKKERNLVFTEMKEKIQEDDISSLLILNKKVPNIEEKLFKSELEKFLPYQKRIAATIYQQAVTLKELTAIWKAILNNPLIKERRAQLDSVDHRKQAAIERFKKAFEGWSDVYHGKTKGVKFYTELYDFAKSTERNVQEFVDNRRDESRRMMATLQERRGVM
ncbi:BRO1-like domain-containing protein [Lipomyces tetrasporus]|uniref:BRO domain-containing protein 1 n=1 Tax=Lipomyces tetrasporus TaxID=54092 RepID=A0AAD7QNH5_9ASCO|nr:BRO1-like domain-containing protein [Lipomyces tetrasporus]KAJ8098265.1 BRO1-like domain-containing protein [Lipomyces tetrasporus]